MILLLKQKNVFFFFKRKPAYEIRISLVGSEMCKRERVTKTEQGFASNTQVRVRLNRNTPNTCLLYTSDAADEEDSVDPGGRRIIKKKKIHIISKKNNNNNLPMIVNNNLNSPKSTLIQPTIS